MAAASASGSEVLSSTGVLHEEGDHLAMSCYQPRDKLVCVLPSSMTANTPTPFSLALAEYTEAPASPSANIKAGPESPTSAAAKPAATAALEFDHDMALPDNGYAVCLDKVPAAPATTLAPNASTAMLACLESCSEGDIDPTAHALLIVSMSIPALTRSSMEDHILDIGTSASVFFLPILDCSSRMKAKFVLCRTKEQEKSPLMSCLLQAISLRAAPTVQLLNTRKNLGIYLHPLFGFRMLVQSPWDPGEQARGLRNPIPIIDSLLVVSWLWSPPDRGQFSVGRPHFHFVSGDKVSMLPWDPGDSTIKPWYMRIIFQSVTSYEFLALLGDFRQQVTDGHKCLGGFDFTMVLYAQDAVDSCLEKPQFRHTDNSWSTHLQFGKLQDTMGALLEMKPWPFWLFDLEYFDVGDMFRQPSYGLSLELHSFMLVVTCDEVLWQTFRTVFITDLCSEDKSFWNYPLPNADQCWSTSCRLLSIGMYDLIIKRHRLCTILRNARQLMGVDTNK